MLFTPLAMRKSATLSFSSRKRGGGIMSSYLFCSKMKYLSGVNTYQEQTIGQGASSSQTHIWLPPPQRPNHVLRVFSDSGKSASFESTFQSLCWTAGLCRSWGGDMCTHTLTNYMVISLISPSVWWVTSCFLIFPRFHIGSEIWPNISLMKRTGECGWFIALRSGSFPLKRKTVWDMFSYSVVISAPFCFPSKHPIHTPLAII